MRNDSNSQIKSLYGILKQTQSTAHSKEILDEYIMRNTMKNRTPINTTVELTPLCNFMCPMCYARLSKDEVEQHGGILRYEKWIRLLKRCVEIGVINFTLSGGECTTHPDFAMIYESLYNLGAEITILTNGSQLSDGLFELFMKCPPKQIYITVYGASEITYETMCKNVNAYGIVYSNIRKLVEHGFDTVLQFTATKSNYMDYKQIKEYANANALKLRVSSVLLNLNNCNVDVIREQSVNDEEFHRIIEDTYTREEKEVLRIRNNRKMQFLTPEQRGTGCGLQCNAARNTFHINWQGVMQPCVSLDAFSVNPENKDMLVCWKEMVAWADSLPMYTDCMECEYRVKCIHCTAQHYNDTHEFGKPSPRLCYKVQHGITD